MFRPLAFVFVIIKVKIKVNFFTTNAKLFLTFTSGNSEYQHSSHPSSNHVTSIGNTAAEPNYQEHS